MEGEAPGFLIAFATIRLHGIFPGLLKRVVQSCIGDLYSGLGLG